MQRITVATDEGPRRVNAEIVGPFALVDCDEHVNITHLFTGLYLCWALPEEARALAEALDNAADWYSVGWLNCDRETLRQFAPVVQSVLAAHRYH